MSGNKKEPISYIQQIHKDIEDGELQLDVKLVLSRIKDILENPNEIKYVIEALSKMNEVLDEQKNEGEKKLSEKGLYKIKIAANYINNLCEAKKYSIEGDQRVFNAEYQKIQDSCGKVIEKLFNQGPTFVADNVTKAYSLLGGAIDSRDNKKISEAKDQLAGAVNLLKDEVAEQNYNAFSANNCATLINAELKDLIENRNYYNDSSFEASIKLTQSSLAEVIAQAKVHIANIVEQAGFDVKQKELNDYTIEAIRFMQKQDSNPREAGINYMLAKSCLTEAAKIKEDNPDCSLDPKLDKELLSAFNLASNALGGRNGLPLEKEEGLKAEMNQLITQIAGKPELTARALNMHDLATRAGGIFQNFSTGSDSDPATRAHGRNNEPPTTPGSSNYSMHSFTDFKQNASSTPAKQPTSPKGEKPSDTNPRNKR